jgi:hypothetical protein
MGIISDFNIWQLQPLKELKWYDFCFVQILPARAVRKFSELGSVFKSVQLENSVVLISLYSVEQRIVRNLICHLEMVGMRYIFLCVNTKIWITLLIEGMLALMPLS